MCERDEGNLSQLRRRTGVAATTGAVMRLLSLAVCAGALVSPVSAQAPMTSAELQVLLVDAAKTTAHIDTLNAKVFDVSARGKALATDFAKHNAEPCEYPQGQPELCANYDRERVDLGLRVAALQKEWAGYESELKPLRLHFAALMTRLRDASYPGDMASWRRPLVACSNVNGVEAAATCLTKAVSKHP
jgi:hypothetical protein